MSTMLLDSPEINAIESRFISLYDRTLKRGIQGNPKTLKQSFKKQFKSATFRIQLDKILNDLCLFTVKYTDSLISEQLTASLRPNQNNLKLFASRETLPLTEEAVRQSIELSEVVAESIIRTLKDEGIYQEGPRVLARKMLDLWGGEKYRAERFARTFSADVATSTTLVRYKQQGIEECQFYATIDSRTSPQCRMMHGTVFKTDSPELDRYKCPLHPHCLVAGTKIKTMEGEKNIEDIQIGTMVLTHLNNYMPVYDTMVRPANNIIEISTANRSIKVTMEHPILTKRNDHYLWIPAGELTEKDEIVII